MRPISDYLPLDVVHDSLLDRLAYAHDASLYRLVPKKVVKPRDESEVISLLRYCREIGESVTFRTGGTSLSGQSVTNGIIADVSNRWMDFKIENSGQIIRLQPGLVGDYANQYLKPYHRRIGPDPASIKAARIGGIFNNNASGMCCGTAQNSYHTLDSVRFILANGHLYDTEVREDYNRFVEQESALANGLLKLKTMIQNSPKSLEKIRKKYRMKNTLGYSMNAFPDFDHPLDIFAHLLVGSEGTLAFLSEIRFQTVPDPPEKSTGLALFPNLREACATLPVLIDSGANAVELMDYASLTTAKYLDNPPYAIEDLDQESAALLIEYQGENPEELVERTKSVMTQISGKGNQILGGFQSGEARRNALWQIRKGLYPTVGSLRKTGTSVITEDIAYPIADLPDVVDRLHKLFEKWHFDDAVVFGHAKDGNLHFVTSIDLDTKAGVKNYAGLMDGLVELTTVVHPGSLKAEHGTGRNMAPFVEAEWGGELYKMMWDVKQLADPQSIMNPGVLLNHDKKIHLKNLKPMPPVDSVVDQCVECGFCEPVCPSRELTTTPRQRIAIAREMELMQPDSPELKSVNRDYQYAGIDTCAVDGLCAAACPVNIDTGVFIKSKRKFITTWIGRGIAAWSAAHFRGTQHFVNGLLRLIEWKASWLGTNRVKKVLHRINKLTKGAIHSWDPGLKASSGKTTTVSVSREKADFVYFPSCLSRSFLESNDDRTLVEIIKDISKLTGRKMIIPKNADDLCCGTPYSSKGFADAARIIFKKTIEELYQVSNEGKLPIVVDTSPCTWKFVQGEHGLEEAVKQKWEKLAFLDLAPFLKELVSDKKLPQLEKQVVLHPTCSTVKMSQVDALKSCAEKCATSVYLPEETGCCGFAGDRGLLFPDLTVAATHREASFVKNIDGIEGVSTSRTCEEGMKLATGKNYISLASLVLEYLKQSETMHLSSS